MSAVPYDQIQVLHKKDCRFCYQQIDERAERCPYCSAPQRRSRSSPLLAVAVLCAGVAVLAVAYAVAVRMDLTRVLSEKTTQSSSATLQRDAAIAARNDALAARDAAIAERDAARQAATAQSDRAATAEQLLARVNGADAAPDGDVSAMLQAAWLLLSACDRVGDAACAQARLDFRRYSRDLNLLQCVDRIDSAARFCWIALD